MSQVILLLIPSDLSTLSKGRIQELIQRPVLIHLSLFCAFTVLAASAQAEVNLATAGCYEVWATALKPAENGKLPVALAKGLGAESRFTIAFKNRYVVDRIKSVKADTSLSAIIFANTPLVLDGKTIEGRSVRLAVSHDRVPANFIRAMKKEECLP